MTNIYLIYCSNDVLVNGSQDRILLCEFRVKVCCLFLAFLKETIIVTIIIIISVCLTIFGLNGGLILLSSRSFHLTSLKKGWCLIASSPPWFWAENKEIIETSLFSDPGFYLHTTESFTNIFLHESFQDGNCLFAQPDWVQDIVMENGLEKIVFIVCFKRRLASHHLVHQHSEGPPVHAGSVVQLLQDLGSDVVRSPAERWCRWSFLDAFFAHSKVGNLDMALYWIIVSIGFC